ncbi:MAG: FkbM family methyltransferase [Thiotrichales bacterium]
MATNRLARGLKDRGRRLRGGFRQHPTVHESIAPSMSSHFHLRIVESPPFSFRLVKWLQARELRGAWRLESLLANRRWRRSLVRTDLARGISIDVPLEYGRAHYELAALAQYRDALVDQASSVLASYPGPFTLIDCGADIGLMSARLVAANPSIRGVIAFEPNPRVFVYLKHNLSLLPCTARAHAAAVASFEGRGTLRSPDFDASDHARYVVRDPLGAIDVLRLDSVAGEATRGNLLLKIDVEGGELAVLRGAARTLRAAAVCVVLFEAHPLHAARTGIDPVEVLQYLQAVLERRLEIVVVEAPGLKIRLDQPLWSQSVPEGVLNLCVHGRRD